MNSKILVTGGLGYIGSHTCVALAEAGYEFVILDNQSTSKPSVLHALATVLNFTPKLVLGDVRDAALMRRIFSENTIGAVIHFAALKDASESVVQPLRYFETNVHGSVNLLHAMQQADVRTLVFSSSAAVYGEPTHVPIREDSERRPANPYGRTKLIVEDILEDLFRSEPGWSMARLRYFNPAGAHPSGLMGDDPQRSPSNLFPRIAAVASGALPCLDVYGNDYDTVDGTGLRDYVHVTDLADGHVAALQQCLSRRELLTLNLGSGTGYTVMEVVQAFEAVAARSIPVEFLARRTGDVSRCWADISAANRTLGWKPTRSLALMCEDAWRWRMNV